MKSCSFLVAVCASCAAWLLLAAPSAAAEDAAGPVSIFDGKTLDGWDGNPKLWSVRDGAITGQTTKENPTHGNTFLIWKGGKPADFELRLKFRIVGGNSGIQYRSHEVDKWVIGGYQADFDAAGGWTGSLYEEKGRGILARRGTKVVIDSAGKKNVVGATTPEKEILASIKKEGWNDYAIIARGNHLVQKVNGLVTVDVTDNQAEKRAASGLLALQLHAGPAMLVQFKDILFKDLSGRSKAADAATVPEEMPVVATTEVKDAVKSAAGKKIVFIAGPRSHGYGAHEHYAGCALLARKLREALPEVETTVCKDGWPKDPSVFDGADAIVMFCDGGGGHMVIPHIDQVDKLAKRGVGIACLHYGVEVPKGKPGDAFLDWIGGYFEAFWSVNPHWVAEFKTLPDHPITRGVKPFAISDEWYYHMRFRKNMEGVTPILSAVAPQSTLARKDGAHSGNPAVRADVAKGLPQHLAWCRERPDGGRGFGFTGAHWHWNWANDNFRTIVLNAVAWIAHIEIPEGGLATKTPTLEELQANQDFPQPKSFDRARIEQMIRAWSK